MKYLRSLFVGVVLLAILSGCQIIPVREQETKTREADPDVVARLLLIDEIKEFEARLGWLPTTNFREYSSLLTSYPFCAQTETFKLDISWRTLAEVECIEAGATSDTMFFTVEALANIGTPVSRTLVRASLARFIMVVFHEDYHEQIRGIPTLTLNESSTQLIGFLAAREFAREKYGENSDLYRSFEREVLYYLEIATIEVRYYRFFEKLYGSIQAGTTTRDDGLRQKIRLYGELGRDCGHIILVTVKKCSDTNNNALLMRRIPYSLYYPLFYDLYRSCNEDVKKTGLTIIELVRNSRELGEAGFVRRVEEVVVNGC